LKKTLQWEIRELQLRIRSPDDLELNSFLENMHRLYLRKLPSLETMISNLLLIHEIVPPWRQGNIVTAEGDSQSQEVWSPGAETESGSGGKLWLPGQE